MIRSAQWASQCPGRSRSGNTYISVEEKRGLEEAVWRHPREGRGEEMKRKKVMVDGRRGGMRGRSCVSLPLHPRVRPRSLPSYTTHYVRLVPSEPLCLFTRRTSSFQSVHNGHTLFSFPRLPTLSEECPRCLWVARHKNVREREREREREW